MLTLMLIYYGTSVTSQFVSPKVCELLKQEYQGYRREVECIDIDQRDLNNPKIIRKQNAKRPEGN